MNNSLENVQEPIEKTFGVHVVQNMADETAATGQPTQEDEVIYVEDMDKDLQKHPKLFEIAKGLKELDKEFHEKLGAFAVGYDGIEISVRTAFRLKET